VGINVGDIIIDGDDIYGDGVNVAARLEGLAEPGGICVSARVQEDARGKLELAFEDAGEQLLKNIERPVRVYRVRLGGATSTTRPTVTLPDKPSIAVLPFQNMSGDPEQEYFADGIVEEITTALSHFRQLFVVARNSSFAYKGRALDVKQVGRELGVRYVLEGGVRKAATRVRIIGQLIDTTTAHIWADRFEGGREDIFDLQDQVTATVVGAIAPKVEQAEMERAQRKPTESLDAYDYYLRGMANLYRWTNREAIDEALRLFGRAIELDPAFGPAHSSAARCHVQRKAQVWVTDPVRETAETARLARRAMELSRDDAVALSSSGWALAFVVRDPDAGVGFVDRALVLNPNLATAWYYSGWLRVWLGKPKVAIEHFAHGMRLIMSPLDPVIPHAQLGTAHAHYFAGHYDEASSWARMALRELPDMVPALRIAAASDALAGRLDDAKRTMAHMRQLDPTRFISNLADVLGPYGPEQFAKYAEGVRKAGLPE
jgi:TolB-like protein